MNSAKYFLSKFGRCMLAQIEPGRFDLDFDYLPKTKTKFPAIEVYKFVRKKKTFITQMHLGTSYDASPSPHSKKYPWSKASQR